MTNGFIIAGQIFTDSQIFWFMFWSTTIISVIAFLLGSSIASFLGVAAERPLRGEGLNGRSHCICGRKLKWHENIPVFGWLKARGRAKCCGSQIPKRYVLSETILGLVYAAAGAVTIRSFLGVTPEQAGVSIISLLVVIVSTIVTFFTLRRLSRKSATETAKII